jgi:lambda repressor-like predicted transcriptional regulator
MDAIDIIYRLRRIGKSQAQLARELGVSSGVVNNVIHDRITAHEVAKHIASLLGIPVTEVWPRRYIFKPRGRAPSRRVNPNQDDRKEPHDDMTT